MDNTTLAILRGQMIIMDMLRNMMPETLADRWLEETTDFKQLAIDLFEKNEKEKE